MAEVDPTDDAIERFVVRHYRSGPARKGRERVDLVAFDNVAEYESRLNVEHLHLERRRAEGLVARWERIEGVQLQPGDRQRATDKRRFMKDVAHGVPKTAEQVPPGVIHIHVGQEGD